MLDLIRTAYGIDAEAVQGGPSWLEWDRFDVLARVPPSTSVETARSMLQSLLADRFKLAFHRDSRPLPAYVLRVGNARSPRLKRAEGLGAGGCRSNLVDQAFLYECRNMTMAAFADGMRGLPGAQPYFDSGRVVNQTGLSGEWDFDFRFSLKPLGAVPAVVGDQVTIFDAIDKQLGLKLEAARIPTPVVVVDSVNRKPSDNPPGVSAILPPPPPASFEVAALRLSDPNAPDVRSAGPLPGGKFDVRAFSLKQLIHPGVGAGWLGIDRCAAVAGLRSRRSHRAAAFNGGNSRDCGGCGHQRLPAGAESALDGSLQGVDPERAA